MKAWPGSIMHWQAWRKALELYLHTPELIVASTPVAGGGRSSTAILSALDDVCVRPNLRLGLGARRSASACRRGVTQSGDPCAHCRATGLLLANDGWSPKPRPLPAGRGSVGAGPLCDRRLPLGPWSHALLSGGSQDGGGRPPCGRGPAPCGFLGRAISLRRGLTALRRGGLTYGNLGSLPLQPRGEEPWLVTALVNLFRLDATNALGDRRQSAIRLCIDTSVCAARLCSGPLRR